MLKLNQIQSQLADIAAQLRLEQLYDATGGYLLNKGSEAADLLLESTDSEREFILHKLCPELEVADVYENNHIILKLK